MDGRVLITSCCILSLALCGCRSGLATLTDADVRHRLANLRSRLDVDSTDAETLRDIGVLQLRLGEIESAEEHLDKSFKRDPGDASTTYYLGIATEHLGQHQDALRLYARYVRFPRRSSDRSRLRGRYSWLTRRLTVAEIRNQIRDSLHVRHVPEQAVAVFPLVQRSGDSTYIFLGKAISSLIAVDLAKVKSLTVVERLRLQIILEELKISASQEVDQRSAPRLGRLIGAGRVVGGGYILSEEEDLDADVTYVEVRRVADAQQATASDQLEEVLRLQKSIVRQLLKSMGITPSDSEEQNLQQVATRSLLALLEYGRGLHMEDQREYALAQEHFRRAAEIDADFDEAVLKSEEMLALTGAGGSAAGRFLVSFNVDYAPLRLDLHSARVNATSVQLDAILTPNQDAREPAVEAGVTSSLPDPPEPPPR